MRRTLRQLAAAKPSRFLEPNTPTGLTGLLTHNSPGSALKYLYLSTLDKLQAFPSSSIYRQSTEALTKHRLKIIESVEPEGYQEWNSKIEQLLKEGKDLSTSHRGKHSLVTKGGQRFVQTRFERDPDPATQEWDGETVRTYPEGQRTARERAPQTAGAFDNPRPAEDEIELEPEPPLTMEQISALENKIGAGLIEEVIQVAEGELKLVDVMYNAKVWENLEETPAEGQWTYFTRDDGPKAEQPAPQAG